MWANTNILKALRLISEELKVNLHAHEASHGSCITPEKEVILSAYFR